jgi:hypothetical protein
MNNVRDFAVGRRNWLFSASADGAAACYYRPGEHVFTDSLFCAYCGSRGILFSGYSFLRCVNGIILCQKVKTILVHTDAFLSGMN